MGVTLTKVQGYRSMRRRIGSPLQTRRINQVLECRPSYRARESSQPMVKTGRRCRLVRRGQYRRSAATQKAVEGLKIPSFGRSPQKGQRHCRPADVGGLQDGVDRQLDPAAADRDCARRAAGGIQRACRVRRSDRAPHSDKGFRAARLGQAIEFSRRDLPTRPT